MLYRYDALDRDEKWKNQTQTNWETQQERENKALDHRIKMDVEGLKNERERLKISRYVAHKDSKNDSDAIYLQANPNDPNTKGLPYVRIPIPKGDVIRIAEMAMSDNDFLKENGELYELVKKKDEAGREVYVKEITSDKGRIAAAYYQKKIYDPLFKQEEQKETQTQAQQYPNMPQMPIPIWQQQNNNSVSVEDLFN
jgi:hypothetical protein